MSECEACESKFLRVKQMIQKRADDYGCAGSEFAAPYCAECTSLLAEIEEIEQS